MLTPKWIADSGRLLDEQLIMRPLTNGNTGRTKTWFSTANERRKFEEELSLLPNRTPYSNPIVLVVTRILGRNQRLWDPSSLGRGNRKELIDAMAATGWFHDDSPEWIQYVAGNQDATRRELGPSIEVQVWSPCYEEVVIE